MVIRGRIGWWRGVQFLGWITLIGGCRREPEQPQPVQPVQPGYGTYTPPPASTAAPPPTITQVQPAPYSPPCSVKEGTCGWALCNMELGKCRWPCGSDADCITGARCVGPVGFAQCIGGYAPPQ